MSRNDIFLNMRKYALANYTKINPEDFILGEAPFNSRCHMNSVQKVKEERAEKVLLCFAIDNTNNSQCVHFINQLKDGKYQDNTWGWLYSYSDYYIIKEVDKSEYEKIWDVLSNTKEMFVNLHTNWFQRWWYSIDKYSI
ncbi:MAG: hypothetical protein PHX04_06880 [Bacilli bacterium]|nr:hypothetical protein [Bacilli bacterium]